ncbi:hypothetical protein RJT34_17741 [Clitoria ternatea]|uniref:Uncharacterized protein n=1 Tax=Clitoria ternatea TaxID=43366 RepID=A0AAN9PES6_CLITE
MLVHPCTSPKKEVFLYRLEKKKSYPDHEIAKLNLKRKGDRVKLPAKKTRKLILDEFDRLDLSLEVKLEYVALSPSPKKTMSALEGTVAVAQLSYSDDGVSLIQLKSKVVTQ